MLMYSYCLAVSRAKNIARQADIVAALTLEVLQGSTAPYDAGTAFVTWLSLVCHIILLLDVHNARPHNGQQLVASRLRSLLHSEMHYSEISGDHVASN